MYFWLTLLIIKRFRDPCESPEAHESFDSHLLFCTISVFTQILAFSQKVFNPSIILLDKRPQRWHCYIIQPSKFCNFVLIWCLKIWGCRSSRR